jgi:hypothetical protein
MRTLPTLLSILLILLISGCQDDSSPQVKIPPQAAKYSQPSQPVQTEQPETAESAPQEQEEETVSGQSIEITGELKTTGIDEQQNPAQEETSKQVEQERVPPTPPVLEDFQGQPQMSLFPRVGDYQPPLESERHPYWRTFIDHLTKVTGVAENQEDGSRGWVFRSVNTIDSLGYFAPFAVKPNTTYNVSFTLRAELPEGASAGIGVLEFNEFLWIGEQYTEETFKKHYRGVHEGKHLTGKPDGKQTFTFTTGPETGMIHLVLFRDGTHDRNALMFDNIEIK